MERTKNKQKPRRYFVVFKIKTTEFDPAYSFVNAEIVADDGIFNIAAQEKELRNSQSLYFAGITFFKELEDYEVFE